MVLMFDRAAGRRAHRSGAGVMLCLNMKMLTMVSQSKPRVVLEIIIANQCPEGGCTTLLMFDVAVSWLKNPTSSIFLI